MFQTKRFKLLENKLRQSGFYLKCCCCLCCSTYHFFLKYIFSSLFIYFQILPSTGKFTRKNLLFTALFQSWWSCMLAVSFSIIFLLKPVFLILHSPKKSYESKLETKKWNKNIDILNVVCFQWSKLKTAKEFLGGEIEAYKH